MIRQIILSSLLLLFAYQKGNAQYQITEIPKELLSRAAATIREENILLELKAPNQLIETGKRIITIHNKSGAEFADLLFFYNKTKQIKEIKGEIFDENGHIIQKFSTKNFKDFSANSETNLFDDYRIKNFEINRSEFPYTIAYTYEIKHSQSLVFPIWRPNSHRDISVQKSTFQIVTGPQVKLRINSKNYHEEPTIESNDKLKTYTWSAENLLASRFEPYSPIIFQNSISIEVVPETFEYFNFKGEITDWHSFGLWMNQNLLKGKRDLPEATIAKVKDLTKNITTDKEKAKVLYEYLQNKTRYISVQIGIGGFEPFPASEVDRLGYGDCKALVNYMMALLEVINIPSYYCHVEAGNTKIDIDPEFANIIDGNHVILCLPFPSDTTYLECTNQNLPFGYLGAFTDDRNVLACTEEGGKILRTTAYGYHDNIQFRKIILTMDENGNVHGTMNTKFKGTQFESHFSNVKRNLDEQKKSLRKLYDINRISFSNINYQIDHSERLTLVEDLSLSIENFAVKNTDNFTVYPNTFNRSTAIPTIRNRKNPVYINRGFTDIDSTEIELPKNLITVVMPMNKKIEIPMASYEFTVKINEGKMLCYRKLQIREGTYSAESYEDFSNFMLEVSLTDGSKYNLSLKKDL